MKLGPWAVTMTITVIYLNKEVACHRNRTCDRLHDSERPNHLSHSIKTKTVTRCVAIVQLHRWFRVQEIGMDALQWTRLWNQLHESVRFFLPLLYMIFLALGCTFTFFFGLGLEGFSIAHFIVLFLDSSSHHKWQPCPESWVPSETFCSIAGRS